MSRNEDTAFEQARQKRIDELPAHVPSDVDWEADRWFARTVAPALTEEFKVWWIKQYKMPSWYPDNLGEQHEYWVRCAFAFMGWRAAKEQES